MDSKTTQGGVNQRSEGSGGTADQGDGSSPVVAYDFRRPDRIPKEQLRSVHLMHDFLARNLASSLGAYLRAYVTVNLVSVEQLSFGEFLNSLPAPTCLSSIGMRPMDGNAVLEMNPTIVFPVLDSLLGGTGTAPQGEPREITDIEQSIFEGVVRVILHDLSEAWEPVAEIEFTVEATETQPQLMQILSPNEAIVAIGFEITMGEASGCMNFGIPSIQLKMMGPKFDQQWSPKRRESSARDRHQMLRLVRQVPVDLDVRLKGASLRIEDLLGLEHGDVVSLGIPVRRSAEVRVNGNRKFSGKLVAAGQTRGLAIQESVSKPSEEGSGS